MKNCMKWLLVGHLHSFFILFYVFVSLSPPTTASMLIRSKITMACNTVPCYTLVGTEVVVVLLIFEVSLLLPWSTQVLQQSNWCRYYVVTAEILLIYPSIVDQQIINCFYLCLSY